MITTASLQALGLGVVMAALLVAALWFALRAYRTRRALLAELSRLRALIDTVPDRALLLLDAAGCVRHWSSAAARLHGFREWDVIGQHYAFLFTPEQRQARVPEDALEDAARGSTDVERVIRMHRDGNALTLESRLTALRDADGRLVGFSVVESDLSARLEQDRVLAEARSQIVGVEKLAALGRLSEGIAHDFNNVVHVIRTSVALLQRQLSADSQASELLRMIERNADRAAGLSQHLLMLGHRALLTPVATDVNAVVSAVVSLLRQTLSENIVVDEQLEEPLTWVILDRSELEAALLHVAANARDAMPRGGTLTFSTAEISAVADGLGVPMPTRHSVAIRIRQDADVGDDAYGHVDAWPGANEDALGLVRGLLEHLHGQVRIERHERGASIALYLPCRAPDASAGRS